jgi:pimeloyl-ACP methyl ester carboxylesterase
LREALLEWKDYQPREERVFADKEVAVVARRRGFTPLSEEAARILCSRSLKEVEGGFSWTTDRRVKHHSSSRMTEEQINAFAAAVQCPVLLLRATEGFSAAADIFAKRWQFIKNGQKKGLPGGHHLHLDESPEQVAEEIQRFLAP